jgi:hypothetical protein
MVETDPNWSKIAQKRKIRPQRIRVFRCISKIRNSELHHPYLRARPERFTYHARMSHQLVGEVLYLGPNFFNFCGFDVMFNANSSPPSEARSPPPARRTDAQRQLQAHPAVAETIPPASSCSYTRHLRATNPRVPTDAALQFLMSSANSPTHLHPTDVLPRKKQLNSNTLQS